MLRSGTTLVEAKSGYGLDLESEVKLLRVIDEARARTPIEISSTYCGGHAVPRGKTVGEATEDIGPAERRNGACSSPGQATPA
ncbi:imidazolonepropionase, putative [Ixodes scapularis]|uniref:Imidazolonepropionase, putative n=1 Tax=Ixodes scapularis TaxID=6945 RepID=B7QD44_IXOSC|nr:imidazolonepropionase, putative [Ixodes scapularis]|eukprot:XP_002413458.1 imidazolonepropionase, putative [Ixodes scapularis]